MGSQKENEKENENEILRSQTPVWKVYHSFSLTDGGDKMNLLHLIGQ